MNYKLCWTVAAYSRIYSSSSTRFYMVRNYISQDPRSSIFWVILTKVLSGPKKEVRSFFFPTPPPCGVCSTSSPCSCPMPPLSLFLWSHPHQTLTSMLGYLFFLLFLKLEQSLWPSLLMFRLFYRQFGFSAVLSPV